MFVRAGPNIRRDELVFSVNLLDIAPTALAVFGLPAGAEMSGRIVVEASETRPDLARIPTWRTSQANAACTRPVSP